MRLATTKEVRSIARKAFVKATGCSYDYRAAYTDKDKAHPELRRVSFRAFTNKIGGGREIARYLEDMLEERGLVVYCMSYTDGGYIRCKAAFEA